MRNFFALSAPYGACQQVCTSKPMLCIEEKGVLLGCYPSRTILAHRVLHNAPYSEIPLGLGIPLFWLLTRYVYSRLQRSREEYQGSFHSTSVLCAICISPEGRDTSFGSPLQRRLPHKGQYRAGWCQVCSPATCVSAMLYGVHFVNTTRKTALVWFVLDRPCLSGTS